MKTVRDRIGSRSTRIDSVKPVVQAKTREELEMERRFEQFEASIMFKIYFQNIKSIPKVKDHH